MPFGLTGRSLPQRVKTQRDRTLRARGQVNPITGQPDARIGRPLPRPIGTELKGGSGSPGPTGPNIIPQPPEFVTPIISGPGGPTDMPSPGGVDWSVAPRTPFAQPGGGMPWQPWGQANPFDVGIGGIDIGPGGISVEGTVGGVPITGTLPFGGGGGGEPTQGSPTVPGAGLVASGGGNGECPGAFSVRDPLTGNCINLTALPPGGKPAMTGPVSGGAGQMYADGFGDAVKGIYGVGLLPRVEVQTVRRCPKGMALGKDGVCYEGLSRNSKKRAWPMGMKPLLTPGERNAIRVAGRVAGKLKRSQKTLKKTARALEKAC